MKIKKWSVSVLGNKPFQQVKEMAFYTSDTDANLALELTDSTLTPSVATITLFNVADQSVVSELVDVVDNEITYLMRDEVIEHSGTWQMQIIFEDKGKDYTSAVMGFSVGGHLLNNNPPKLEVVDSWTTLKKQADAMVRNYNEDLKALHSRIDQIITENKDGISVQEIVDARQGKESLGANLRDMKDKQQNDKNDSDVKSAVNSRDISRLGNALSMVNINQEAKQTVEGADVLSLPKNAGEGAGTVGLEGLTVTNLVENGAKVQPTDSVSIDTIDGNKYYDNFKRVIFTGDSLAKTITNDTEKEVSIAVYNLTQTFGAGNEPSKEWCGAHLADYIDGTKSVATPKRIKSVGKNLWDDDRAYKAKTDSYNANVGKLTRADKHSWEMKYTGHDGRTNVFCPIAFEPNSDYTFSLNATPHIQSVYLVRSDLTTYTILDYNINGQYSRAFNTGKEKFIGIQFMPSYNNNLLFTFENIKVEKGTTATSYSPNITTHLYLNNNVELRSLPNGVKDEIRPDGKGGYELVKRVGKVNLNDTNFSKLPVVVNEEVSVFRSTYLGGDLKIPEPKSWGYRQFYLFRKDIPLTLSGYTINSLTKVGDYVGYLQRENDLGLDIAVPTGKTLEEAFGENTHWFIYQLATPEIIPLSTSGNLTTYPSGTVYFENVIADAGMYTDKFTAIHNYPIKEIESLTKLNELGEEITLDTSKTVITDNSFTHPDLAEYDIVFVEYYYESEQPTGNNSIEHYDTRYTIKDTANDKFYQWNITSTNGQPQITLEEA